MIWSKDYLSRLLSLNLTQINCNQFNNVRVNSKYVEEGDIFITLQGTESDGHDFIDDAISRGARLVLYSKDIDKKFLNPAICIKSDNLKNKLIKLAKDKRSRSKAKFIAITGSAGKTTSKEILHHILSKNFKTFKSPKSFNYGVHIISALASIPDDIEYAIFEFGMNKKGEILKSTEIFQIDIIIINNVFPVHIEFFQSIEEIAEAKSEILQRLDSSKSISIINFDMYKEIFLKHIRKLKLQNIIIIGKDKYSQIELEKYHVISTVNELKVQLIYSVQNTRYSFVRSYIDKSLGENFRSVLGVILALNLDINESIKEFSNFTPQLGRGKILSILNNQGKNLYLYCDYFNSNPIAVQKSLMSLANMPQNDKIAIIGDMLELGKDSKKFHSDIVPFIKNAKIKKLILVGKEVKIIFEQVKDMQEFQTFIFPDVEALMPKLDKLLIPESITLIKASRKIGLEKILKNWNIKDVI
ncbi:MAG: UDP-N-acetylmuramoyl-tripeptide--D-alanyl-D-alanine ligase [Rickettsia sp.]|nr:UDP-N-acetylmuramoyl-tripeptide--D-alanyl-D-alanine ligase [Rickettsia sp.]